MSSSKKPTYKQLKRQALDLRNDLEIRVSETSMALEMLDEEREYKERRKLHSRRRARVKAELAAERIKSTALLMQRNLARLDHAKVNDKNLQLKAGHCMAWLETERLRRLMTDPFFAT